MPGKCSGLLKTSNDVHNKRKTINHPDFFAGMKKSRDYTALKYIFYEN
jgi:hypothetical protein